MKLMKNTMSKPMEELLHSPTAEYHCSRGRWFRWVSRLSPGERDAVRAGGLVWFTLPGRTHRTQSGFKVVAFRAPYRWDAREPTPAELDAIRRLLAAEEEAAADAEAQDRIDFAREFAQTNY